MTASQEITIVVSERHAVSGLLMKPDDAFATYVLAHGAGAGMRHAFLEETAGRLADAGVATLRFQFPYTEANKHRPDPPALLEATVRAAVARATGEQVPVFAGGKSMGGRMTSQAQSSGPMDGVRGIVFLGFPLHAPKQPSVSRAKHLDGVSVPLLFVQGTRDDFADLDLMRGVCAALGKRAVLHVVDGGDHSFRVLKRSGRDGVAVMDEIQQTVVMFMRSVLDKETT